MTTEPLYTVTQAAALTGRKVASIQKQAQKGRIGHKLGPLWVLTAADLDILRSMRGPGRPRGSGKRQVVEP